MHNETVDAIVFVRTMYPMAFLNIPVPNFKAFVHGEFFYNGVESAVPKDKRYVPAIVYGLRSIPGQTPLWHVMTENGVLWDGLPSHALCFVEGAPVSRLEDFVLWDSFSWHVSVTQYPLFDGMSVKTKVRGKVMSGTLMFVLDWAASDPRELDTSWAHIPEEHKTGNVIALENGALAIQPNNRIIAREPSFVVKPYTLEGDDRPDYKSNRQIWSAESGDRVTEDSDKHFYKTLDDKEYRDALAGKIPETVLSDRGPATKPPLLGKRVKTISGDEAKVETYRGGKYYVRLDNGSLLDYWYRELSEIKAEKP